MRLLPRRLTAPLRHWRTAKGFGVHSPFAYHFITRVLRERLPYYDFDRLAEVRGAVSAHDARLIYRLTDYFQPSTAAVSGPLAAPAGKIMQMAHPAIKLADKTSGEAVDMIIGSFHSIHDPNQAPVCVIFCQKKTEIERLASQVTHGMTFAQGHILICVSRHGLPRQDFRLRF